MCFTNPSRSALSRAFAISSDLATDLCKSITQMHLTFCEQFNTSNGHLPRLIDLADGEGPEGNALDVRIVQSERAEIALQLVTDPTSENQSSEEPSLPRCAARAPISVMF